MKGCNIVPVGFTYARRDKQKENTDFSIQWQIRQDAIQFQILTRIIIYTSSSAFVKLDLKNKTMNCLFYQKESSFYYEIIVKFVRRYNLML